MRASTIWQGLMLPPWRFVISRWPWLALVHVVLTSALFLITLPVVALTVIALPLWAILLAALERRRLRMLGAPRRTSGHVRIPREERHNWLNVRLTEPATWRETAALLAGLVIGALALALLILQLVAVAMPIALAVLGYSRPPAEVNLFEDVWISVGAESWWHPLPWLPLIMLIMAYANAALAALHASVIGWLIAPRAEEIDRRVEQLTRSRAAIVTAHEVERRRIERDLHDGVQQELVGIAARLGLLELELASRDVDAAQRALRTAQNQTERALARLRETVRGIHPAVLTDHGLLSALEELAGRSALPLQITDNGFPRLSPAAEAAGYFLVSEALTNAAKHTVASRVAVELGLDGGIAYVSVTDDGHGGADAAGGTGISGLAGRAESLGGALTLTSPVGGPTVLRMDLPVADFADTSDRNGGADANPPRR
ncbi:sensor histidine kinase [Microbacterium sp. A82]|uniref:sensor histidine kinase n=1 Tax=unclassified Microbacterium TaxID=2609290 RepID=UPI003F414930